MKKNKSFLVIVLLSLLSFTSFLSAQETIEDFDAVQKGSLEFGDVCFSCPEGKVAVFSEFGWICIPAAQGVADVVDQEGISTPLKSEEVVSTPSQDKVEVATETIDIVSDDIVEVSATQKKLIFIDLYRMPHVDVPELGNSSESLGFQRDTTLERLQVVDSWVKPTIYNESRFEAQLSFDHKKVTPVADQKKTIFDPEDQEVLSVAPAGERTLDGNNVPAFSFSLGFNSEKRNVGVALMGNHGSDSNLSALKRVDRQPFSDDFRKSSEKKVFSGHVVVKGYLNGVELFGGIGLRDKSPNLVLGLKTGAVLWDKVETQASFSYQETFLGDARSIKDFSSSLKVGLRINDWATPYFSGSYNRYRNDSEELGELDGLSFSGLSYGAGLNLKLFKNFSADFSVMKGFQKNEWRTVLDKNFLGINASLKLNF